MSREQDLKEIREARVVGQRALLCLGNASELLNSAGNWGLWDLFGGGFISSMVKHSKLQNANQQMEEARQELLSFQKELRDIHIPDYFRVNVSDFLVFADFFFDGVIADWLVQSRISEAKEQVRDAIDQVKAILNQLNQWESSILREV